MTSEAGYCPEMNFHCSGFPYCSGEELGCQVPGGVGVPTAYFSIPNTTLYYGKFEVYTIASLLPTIQPGSKHRVHKSVIKTVSQAACMFLWHIIGWATLQSILTQMNKEPFFITLEVRKFHNQLSRLASTMSGNLMGGLCLPLRGSLGLTADRKPWWLGVEVLGSGTLGVTVSSVISLGPWNIWLHIF